MWLAVSAGAGCRLQSCRTAVHGTSSVRFRSQSLNPGNVVHRNSGHSDAGRGIGKKTWRHNLRNEF
jgi:hypothetical protein